MGISYAVICLCHCQEAEKSTEFFFTLFFLANYVYVFESNFVLVSIPQSAGVNEIPSEFVGPLATSCDCFHTYWFYVMKVS